MGVLRSAAHRRAESRFWGVFIIAVHRAFVLGLGARHHGIVELSEGVIRCVTVFACYSSSSSSRTRVSRRTMEDGNDEVSIERVLRKECTAHAAGGQPRTKAINYFLLMPGYGATPRAGGQGRLVEVGAPINPELTADAEEGGDVGPLGAARCRHEPTPAKPPARASTVASCSACSSSLLRRVC